MRFAERVGEGLQVRALACVRGGRPVFAGLSFDAGAAQLVQLRGANGSGKSSLLRLLCGLARPARGEIRWRRRAAGAACQGDAAYLGHASGLDGELTVAENLHFALQVAGSKPGASERREALQRLGLAGRESVPVRQLSAGQKKRLMLARVWLSERPLWLLDEPEAGLDSAGEQALADCLAAHLARGGVAVVASHRDAGAAFAGARQLLLEEFRDARGHGLRRRA
jgi:heme exporter protein A